MNPFRKIMRGRDVEEISTSSSASTSSKKNKKNTTETTTTSTKFEFDLENALPSTDEFRTSLLMPKLSARFSMLREQDDPNTKVGKANDDSVLFPKRASRLNLFGHNSNPLSDIAEVSSVGDRPSLSLQRSSSFVSAEDGTTDDDQSHSGSIMSRKRPGEGNNLFGGRQKIYKIPIKDGDSDSGTGLRGRAVYEDDITLSAFQQFRLREKEQKRAQMALEGTLDTEGSLDTEDNAATLSTKRTTSSSTTSGRSHRPTSTAATSVDDQPVSATAPSTTSNNSTSSPVKPAWAAMASERHVTKTRRLYDERLAQTVQDQQTSAMSRLESLRRQRAGAGTPEPPRLRRNFSRSAANLSDKPSKIQPVQAAPVYGGARPSPTQQTPDSPDSEAVSPVSGQPLFNSPLGSNEESSTLAAALNPEDRGKATAMGLFNKPSGQFDEERFQRLQMQMHESRTQAQQRSPSNSVSKPDETQAQSEVQSETQTETQTIEGRPPDSSATRTRSRAESASSHYSSNAPRSGPSSRSQSVAEASFAQPVGETMLHLTDSESEAPDESFTRPPSSAGRPRPLDSMHPAFRSRPQSRESDTRPPSREQNSGLPDLKIPMQDLKLNDAPPSPIPEEVSDKAADSPTLGPSGPGLSGLIRSLRHTSYQSTIRPSSAGQSESLQPGIRESHPPASIHSNPFEYDDLDGSSFADSVTTTTATTRESREQDPGSLRDQRPDVRAGSRDGNDDTLGRRAYHRREDSTETQREREEFEHELAQRRRRVEETLHRISESESRSQSPVPGATEIPSRPGSALAMFKNRAGKSNKDQSGMGATSKGLRMLGLAGPAAPNGSTPSLHSTDSHRDGDSAPGLGLHINTSSTSIASARKGPVQTPSASGTLRGLEDDDHHRNEWPTGTSRVSKSFGTRFYRSESPSLTRREYPPSATGSARPSIEMAERSASAMSGTFRSNSRAADLHLHTDVGSIGASPRPSPVAAYSANTTPPLHETPGYGTSSRRSSTSGGLPKRHVDKSQISEPTLVSSTSQVPIVDLPAGASLSNGMEPPPIPPMNPRRRRGTMTQQIKNIARGGQQSRPQSPSVENPTWISGEERSVFEDDDSSKRSASRGKLRKLPSEGTSLHSRNRQHAAAAATAPAPPAVPPYGHSASVEGGMI